MFGLFRKKSPLDYGEVKKMIDIFSDYIIKSAFDSADDLVNKREIKAKKEETTKAYAGDLVMCAFEFLTFDLYLFATKLAENSKANKEKNSELFVDPIYDYLFETTKNKFIKKADSVSKSFKDLLSEFDFDELMTEKVSQYDSLPLITEEITGMNLDVTYKTSSLSLSLVNAMKIINLGLDDSFLNLLIWDTTIKKLVRNEGFKKVIEGLRINYNKNK